MLADMAIAGLNHVLSGEEWASNHLKAFSGQTLRLETGSMALALNITPDGFFRRQQHDSEGGMPAVILSLPADIPLRLLSGRTDRSSLLASARISGSADLADCLGFVFRNLRWDVESDLAPLLGDIAAHRLVRTGLQILEWQHKQAWSLARNLVEYFTEEKPAIARQQDISEFCNEVGRLQDQLASLEKRIAALD